MTAGHAAFGYDLWLVPAGDALHRLQGVVDRLAEVHNGPVFTPHVTLLSGLAADEASLIETNRGLAAGLEPFNLDLTVPEAGTTFFQCIYMRVAESSSLPQARQAAGEAFALPADNYMPHLLLFSSGEMTAYEIRLRRDANDQELVMRGDILGDIELVTADE
jgi:hypothetical protein